MLKSKPVNISNVIPPKITNKLWEQIYFYVYKEDLDNNGETA